MATPTNYNYKQFIGYLDNLVASRDTSYRDAALKVGLEHGTISRLRNKRQVPRRDTCILLAEALASDPNEMLQMAGYKPLAILDPSLVDPADFPSDIKEFAASLKKIPFERRRALFSAFQVMAKADFE
ncbi:MAG TPA: XRE family transcriptional regulator [Anaerolineae bacterium]|nr:XRE family transcriptional regulator [Anaerolineae bacterium]